MTGKQDYQAMKKAVLEIVGQYFKPEFINRIDATVVFHPLSKENIKRITYIQLQNVAQRLKNRDLHLVILPKALDHFAEIGYDANYGARPLRRVIQTSLENKLAQDILQGKYLPGDKIQVDYQGEEIVFSKG
jgi:ATP-dependent Clp protease ATP-binding subunit ClpB